MPKRNPGPKLKWRAERGQWEIQWFENGQRYRQSAGRSRDEADKNFARFLNHAAASQAQSQTGPRDPNEVLIAEVLADYLENKIGSHSAATTGYNIKALMPFWGHLFVGDISENLCRAYVNHRNVKPTTAARELSVLQSAMNLAWRRGQITRQVPLWKPSGFKPKDRWLTREEAARLLKASRKTRHLSLFVLIGLYTGARAGAILDLRWYQINLETGFIDFNPKIRLATHKGRSLIPLPPSLLSLLRRWRGKGELRPVIEYKGRHVKSIKKSFSKVCKQTDLKDVTPHTLRHTCATWLTQSGVPFPKIARWLGHKNSRTTEAVYAHHAPGYLDDVKQAFRQ